MLLISKTVSHQNIRKTPLSLFTEFDERLNYYSDAFFHERIMKTDLKKNNHYSWKNTPKAHLAHMYLAIHVISNTNICVYSLKACTTRQIRVFLYFIAEARCLLCDLFLDWQGR